MPQPFKIVAGEANYWWRNNAVAGALLNKVMLLFVIVPIVLVLQKHYVLSVTVFVLMVPYGFLVQALATRAVRRHIEAHPETLEEFETSGILTTEAQRRGDADPHS